MGGIQYVLWNIIPSQAIPTYMTLSSLLSNTRRFPDLGLNIGAVDVDQSPTIHEHKDTMHANF